MAFHVNNISSIVVQEYRPFVFDNTRRSDLIIQSTRPFHSLRVVYCRLRELFSDGVKYAITTFLSVSASPPPYRSQAEHKPSIHRGSSICCQTASTWGDLGDLILRRSRSCTVRSVLRGCSARTPNAYNSLLNSANLRIM